MTAPAALVALQKAAAVVRLDVTGANAIRLAENAIYRLRDGIVARVARPGQQAAAAKEVAVAEWLADAGVPAVRVVREVDQPVCVDDRAVTFWHELPPHEPGSLVDIATALRGLHALPPPANFELPTVAPFARLTERIEAAETFTADDRRWLLHRLAELVLQRHFGVS